jgi:tetratricopeptide (TPR) repeat protein
VNSHERRSVGRVVRKQHLVLRVSDSGVMASPDAQVVASTYQAALGQLRQGRHEDGIDGLRKVISSPEKSLLGDIMPDVHGNLGTALAQMHRNEEAATSYLAAISLRPDSGFLRYNLAVTLAESGRNEEAEQQYRAAAKFGSAADGAPSAYNNLGNLLVGMGRRAEARSSFLAALSSNPRHAQAHNNLANMLRDGGGDDSLRSAGRHYSEAVRLSPRYREAYRNLGNLLKERPEWHHAAVRAYRIALSLSAGDGGRDVLLNLGEVLQWVGRHDAAKLTFELGVARGVWQHPQQRPSHFLGGLRAAPWWDPSALPLVRRLLLDRSRFEILRKDGLALLSAHSSSFRPYHSPALASGDWSDVTLAISGSRQPGADQAPASYELYTSLGEDATSMVMGSAYFSVLSSGARLRAHTGPTNIRLRVHIALSVPADGAAMRVGNETRPWRVGEALVFDDSFEHEVWNESDEPRLVFIFDVWHPMLENDEQRLDALDRAGRQRYQRTTSWLRNGLGLPNEPDLLDERRKRTIF